MVSPTPFSFSVLVDEPSTGPDEFVDVARRVEGLGYSGLYVTDRFFLRLAPIPALTAAAMVTERIRLGTYVLNGDVRNPAVTAREMATLHDFSSGRAVLGVGWSPHDHNAAQTPLRRGSDRLLRREASLAVIRSTLDDTTDPGLPRLPLLLGGCSREALTLAGQVADVVSIVPPLGPTGCRWGGSTGADAVDRQVATVRAAAAGRTRPPVLDYMCTHLVVTRDAEPVITALSRCTGYEPEALLSTPSFLVGSAAGLTDVLLARRERWGFSSVVVPAGAARSFAPVMEALRRTDSPMGSARERA